MVERIRDTARGVVVKDGHMLFMERWRDDQHYYSIPGGGIEDEMPEETVIREIAEETGLVVNVKRLIMILYIGERTHHIYECEYVSGEPHLPDNAPEQKYTNDHNRFKPGWVPLKDVAQISLIYWEPIREPLVAGLHNGFPDEVTIVRA
jgi:8-oxo-dGTP diphosphatase